jgi:hypothetical protein
MKPLKTLTNQLAGFFCLHTRPLSFYTDGYNRLMYTVLIGTAFSTSGSKTFSTEAEVLAFVVEQAHKLVDSHNKARLEQSLKDGVVSEDGAQAISLLLKGELEFAKAIAKYFAPQLSIVSKTYQEDKDD